ncbi:hypothetical protein BS47DRAFT_1377614 [Hydnum rufescens UP504]|uniref:Uncharacterized protein n=1 Tax=Hydnum rufescens UP504 TaxID=1448309 RepID=A0A9P6DNT0_9AGAM|nr:hypothetical protein BS47DRAFT_1377614 [Hydnum rufescens UP504]
MMVRYWRSLMLPGVLMFIGWTLSRLGSIVASRSDGQLSRITPSPSGWEHLGSWPAHHFEAWIAAWNYYDENVIYPGREFDAGVTTIQCHPHVEHLLATGSYVDSVRMFDVHYPLRPLVSVNVGGGAWRVKWHPNIERKEDLVVACMRDGFKVVRLHDSVIAMGSIEEEPVDDKWLVTTRFDEHASLAYGVHWK